jgi:hypothetical protein
VAERVGTDYKGRFHLQMRPVDGAPEEVVELVDVRWNSERTARRTLDSMSPVELRRRLRSARGRHAEMAARV